ncbi:hypothetical protein A9K55_000923 [Cordyceps militaris]|uniref:Uncharacterized protein n=1 Tax=Cordyceps militaris TaxID=73501 RepID=A0A2H4STT6_CORMI|nr:hypothetical protein A9K55_000923 [Cordyceps militaris]
MSNMKTTLPCPAWIYSIDSNVQASSSRAKDRSWFGDDYQTISSVLGVKYASTTLNSAVIGIGTVDLPVKRRPDARGKQSHAVLRLRNVLHVPSCLCNVIGTSLGDNYVLRPGRDGTREITDSKGRSVAYLQPSPQPAPCGNTLLQLRLSGPPIGPRVGPSPFKPATSYKISAWWHDDERERVLRLLGTAGSTKSPVTRSAAASFNAEERAWIKKAHGSIWAFMRAHKLRGGSEDDAATARHIIRSFTEPAKVAAAAAAAAQSSVDSGLGMDGSVVGRGIVAEADKHFGPAELAWVREKYGDGLSFMVSLRLRFLEAGDGRKANKVAAILMSTTSDKGS